MGDLSRINRAFLNNKKSSFASEKSHFHSTTYATFRSSYLCNCGDYSVRRMREKLNNCYSKIESLYSGIDSFLVLICMM